MDVGRKILIRLSGGKLEHVMQPAEHGSAMQANRNKQRAEAFQ